MGCGVMEAAESCFAFFLAEGERMRGAEEVEDEWILETELGRRTGGCAAALEASTRV